MRAPPGALLVIACVPACVATGDPGRRPPPARQHASPNASILPAPLAPASELTAPARHRATSDAAPADPSGRVPGRDLLPPSPPEVIPVATPLAADTLPARDIQGHSLTAEFRFSDVPGQASVPESSASALREASQATALDVVVDLAAPGRMRFAFDSPAFPVAARAELRARSSYYGHVLVWPDGAAYRNVAPGTLRALFEEQRLDVSPPLRGKITSGPSGTKLAHKTTAVTVETSLGSLYLEQATTQMVGSCGDLLCRLLVELVGAEPSLEACRPERIPVLAQYRFSPSGELAFVVTSLVEKKDLSAMALAVPPEGARFSPGDLPFPGRPTILPAELLGRLRLRPLPTGAPRRSAAPPDGISVENRTTLLQYLLLDGIPVARIRPGTTEVITGPARGRYGVAFRDFFGTDLAPPELVELPVALRIGTAPGDAGP